MLEVIQSTSIIYKIKEYLYNLTFHSDGTSNTVCNDTDKNYIEEKLNGVVQLEVRRKGNKNIRNVKPDKNRRLKLTKRNVRNVSMKIDRSKMLILFLLTTGNMKHFNLKAVVLDDTDKPVTNHCHLHSSNVTTLWNQPIEGDKTLVESVRSSNKKETMEGNTNYFCQTEVNWSMDRIKLNKLMKIKNGNRNTENRKQLVVGHWNMGSKLWSNKIEEIEALTQQHNLDILIISEANLLNDTAEHDRNIEGYQILLPLTIKEHKVARLVVLTRNGLNIDLEKKFMDNQISAVWMKVGMRGRKPLYLTGIYREHRYLYQETDESASDRNQLLRWKRFVNMWTKAAENRDLIVLGDTNIDYLRWNLPDPAKTKLVELMKNEIETLGFFQTVTGKTRSWKNMPDSLIDQCWSNCTSRIVYTKNIERNFSDHNLIIIAVKMKDNLENRHNTLWPETEQTGTVQNTADWLEWLTGNHYYKVRT